MILKTVWDNKFIELTSMVCNIKLLHNESRRKVTIHFRQ